MMTILLVPAFAALIANSLYLPICIVEAIRQTGKLVASFVLNTTVC